MEHVQADQGGVEQQMTLPAWAGVEYLSIETRQLASIADWAKAHLAMRSIQSFKTGVPGFDGTFAPVAIDRDDRGNNVAYVAIAIEEGSGWEGKAYPYDLEARQEDAILTKAIDERKFVARALRVARAVDRGESRRDSGLAR